MRSRAVTLRAIAFLSAAAGVYYGIVGARAGQEQARQAQPAKTLSCLGKFATHEEADDFLRTARIVKSRRISAGVTGSQKLTLEKDGRQESGIFKTIDERNPGITSLPTGPELDFKDSWKFEVGAYEMDKLLGLNMVPPTVDRFYENKQGSLQLWINDCISEEERSKRNLTPPDPTGWGGQILKQRVFDNLIYDIDRNSGNILISANWEMILIDHSRSFKNSSALKTPKDLTFFSRSLMEAFGKLDEKRIRDHAGKFLTVYEIRAVLQRRDKILALFKKVANNPDAVYP